MKRKAFLWAQQVLCALLVVCLLAPGCSVPNDEHYDTLRAAVGAFQPETAGEVARWEAAKKAYSKICDETDDDTWEDEVLTFECEDAEGDLPIISHDRVWLCQCMANWNGSLIFIPHHSGGATSFRTIFECLDMGLDQAHDMAKQFRSVNGIDAGDVDCYTKVHNIGELEDRGWSKDENTPKDAVDELVSSRELPGWAVYLGVGFAIVGGAVVITTLAPKLLPALCALREGAGNSCPTDPDYAPGSTPQHGGTQ